MKRFFVTLSITILLAVILPCFHVLAQPTQIPHEYPPEDKPLLEDSKSLLNYYYDVATLIENRQYYDVQVLLEEIESASTPTELQGIIKLYTNISQELAVTLNNIEALHSEATTLFSQNQFSDARKKLVDAEESTSSALMLLEDLEIANETLGESLAIFSPLIGIDVLAAYERQVRNIQQIYQLIYELDQIREDLDLNPRKVITTKFYHSTLLEVSATKTAYAGVPFTVGGQVSSTGAKVERTINIFLDDTQVAQEEVRERFNIQIDLAPQISTGRHLLKVEMPPQGHYTGALKNLIIEILGVPIRADIRIPQFTVFAQEIRISGNVYHRLTPIKDAEVSVVFEEATTKVRTSTDGSFTTTIKVLDDSFLIGPRALTMTIDPVEPQYMSLEIKRQIMSLHWANISVMLVAFVLLGMLVFNRVRTRLPRPVERILTTQAKLPELPTIGSPGSRYESTGIKGRILSAYLNGLGVIEKVITIQMMPHTTLREYVNTASTLLPAAIKPFTELTSIAENALYSSHKLDQNTAAKAEELASIIKEELRSGVA